MDDPVCTITEALSIAFPGDTIFISPGVYSENITLPFDVELVGLEGSELTILDGQNLQSVVTIPLGVTGTIDSVTVRNGIAFPPGLGGGINVIGDLVLRNSTVTANRTLGFMGIVGGGGIAALNFGSTVVIEGCTIHDNYSDKHGGGIAVRNATLSMENTTVSGNGVHIDAYRGGGIYAADSLVQIRNTTISGNSASQGGGVWIRNPVDGSMILDVTITKNDHVGAACQVQNALGNTTLVHLQNSIVAGNFGYDTPLFTLVDDVGGDVASLGNNLIGIAYTEFSPSVLDLSGTLANPLDPRLGPLSNNGGRTLTHALLPDSPAIDAGVMVPGTDGDQRGAPRPQGMSPDIGAFEFGSPVAMRSLCTGDGGDQMGCTDCPCSNNATLGTLGGCLNALGLPGALAASGSTSVSLPSNSTDDLRFTLATITPSTFSVLISGDNVAPQGMANPCFGLNSGAPSGSFQGLRCAVGSLLRHGGRSSDVAGNIGFTNKPWGGEGAPPVGIAQAFGGFQAGRTRYFQAIYREPADAVCMRGLNTSQAVEISFEP